MDDKTRAASTHSITVFLLFIFPRSVFGVPPLRLVQQAAALVIFCLFLWVFLELRKDGKKKKGDYRQYTIYNCMDGGKTRSPAQYNIIIRRRNLNRIWANVRCTLFSFRHFLLLSWWSECKRAFVIPFNVQMQLLPLPHKHSTAHTGIEQKDASLRNGHIAFALIRYEHRELSALCVSVCGFCMAHKHTRCLFSIVCLIFAVAAK